MSYPFTITFYSYKGGVGRSLLAANIGYLRARRGKTLLWDLDVEAPGLHRIGKLAPSKPPVKGLFEWLIEWQDIPRTTRPDFPGLLSLALPTPVAENLYVLPACGEGASVADMYEPVRWDDFLKNDLGLGMGLFREAIRAFAAHGFETVILDARTGYTDIGGLLAALLPHVTVLVGNYGRQNVMGLAEIWQALTPMTADSGSPAASREPLPPLQRLLVASPIPMDRPELLAAGQKVWKDTFGLLPTERIEVPYHPDLPFTEDLLAQSQPESATAKAYFQLDQRLEEQWRAVRALENQIVASEQAQHPELRRGRSTVERGKTFEERVGQLLRLQGFEVQGETLVDANRIDLIASKKLSFGRSETWFVECKDYAAGVGKEVVDTLKSWLDDPQARERRAQGMIVAAKSFAPAALAAAENKGILALTYADLERSLFDFSDYLRRIRARFEASPLARWYVDQLVCLEKLPDAEARPLLPHALDWAQGTGSRLWLLLGDYGTGKSCFVERFAYELACRCVDDPSQPVPLVINLKDYPNALSLESLLQEHMRKELGQTVDPAILLHLHAAGRVLLLLDSFDEMGLAQAGRSMDEQLRLLIRTTASSGDGPLGNRLLLTSRTHLFKDQSDARQATAGQDQLFAGDSNLGRSARAFDAVIDQLPVFTSEQIKDYLTRRLGEAEAEQAAQFIHNTYNLEALAEVPQLLDMIVASLPALIQQGGSVSPGALYVTYTNQWLERYRRAAQELSAEQLRNLLEWLSRLLWARTENQIHYADLARSLHDIPELAGGLDPQRMDLELRTAAFLIRNPEGQYRFSHRSFLEFFLARAILRAAKEARLADMLAIPRLSPEVCRFVHDLTAAQQDSDCLAAAVRGILEKPYRKQTSENALILGYRLAEAACTNHQTKLGPENQARWLPERAGLAGADLNGISMPFLELPAADLRGASLLKADLSFVQLPLAQLDGANLDDAQLIQTNLSGSRLLGASCLRVMGQALLLEGADCRRLNAAGATLRGMRGAGSQWEGAVLRDANWAGAVLDSALSLQKADLLRLSAPHAQLPQGLEQLSDFALLALQPYLSGHAGPISACAFSPEGSHLLTASYDNTGRLWDAASGQEVLRLTGHENEVTACAFSPDGSRLLTGSRDKTARLWDAASGQEVLRFEGHGSWVSASAFSPDGSRILTGSWDNTARLWDAASGKEVLRLEGHGGWVSACAFSPDGSRLLIGSEDHTASLWDAASGQEVLRFEGHRSGVTACAFSPDGSHLLTGSWDNTARLWDAASGQEVLRLEGHGNQVSASAFSPDGRRILTGSRDMTARLWDATSGKEVLRLEGHGNGGSACAFSPDGSRLLTGSDDNTARLWDAASGKAVLRLEGHGDRVSTCAFSPDGRRILTGSRDMTARLWDAASGKEVLRLEGHGGMVSACAACAFSPDGSRLLTASDDNTARLWDAASGKEVLRFEGHGSWVSACAFSPNGSRLLTGSWDDTVRLWDAASGKEVLRLEGHGEPVSACAFSPDGSRLLTASYDDTARLWDAASGKEVLRFEGHRSGINACAFSPDGSRILTGSDDHTAWLWDAASGKEILRLTGHENRVTACAFSPDGRRILTTSDDRSTCLWDAETGEALMRYLSDGDSWLSIDTRTRKWRGEGALTEQVVYVDPTLPPLAAPRHCAADLPELRAE